MLHPSSFFRIHKRTLAGLVFGLAFSVLTAYAIPPGTKYSPGDTLDPNCVPGSSNCSVSISSSTTWGSITGTLSSQTDLQTALDAKFDDPAGTTSQYIRGDGTVAALPITVQNSNSLFSTGLSGAGAGSTATDAIFLGTNAGSGATDASRSNFIGYNAGLNATDAVHANFFGNNAGSGADQAYYSNFIGANAGLTAVNAEYSNFFGRDSGYGTTNAAYSNFLGRNAGYQATDAYSSTFIGDNAGHSAAYANNSTFIGDNAGYQVATIFSYPGFNANFIGSYAGYQATDAQYATFIGSSSGYTAANAGRSVFIGTSTGQSATNAANSVFIGYRGGSDATNAANSIFIGTFAGDSDDVDNTAPFDNTSTFANTSILIGHKTATNGFSNSIALGAYAQNTASNQLMVGSTNRRIEDLVFNGGTGNTCSINAGTGITCSSDERLKTNIEDLDTDTLDKVLQLRTVSYNWNSDPNGNRMVGFIAQNLQPFFPELVTQNIDGMLSVNYAQMTPILAEAIRELDGKITSISDLTKDNTWRTSLLAWFADRTNGIAKFFAGEVHTDMLCVKKSDGGEVCLSGDQLQGIVGGQTTTVIVPEPTQETPPNEEQPAPSEEEPAPEEVRPTPEASPEPAPEAETPIEPTEQTVDTTQN